MVGGPALDRVREWWVDEDARWGGGAEMAGDSALGRIVYAVVRATRPDVVVETGVATGVTSAYLLAALEDNGHGALHSIDLPPTDMVAAGHVGAAIPADLKARWTYHWGSSRRLLSKVLRPVRDCAREEWPLTGQLW
jgi:predicted O-methyltransferase YrrM